jgi:hypothetical protein
VTSSATFLASLVLQLKVLSKGAVVMITSIMLTCGTSAAGALSLSQWSASASPFVSLDIQAAVG